MRDLFVESCLHKYKDSDYLGQIKVKSVKNGDATVEEREMVKWTYGEAFKLSQNLGSQILENKLEYSEKLLGQKFIGVFAKNRYEWTITDLASILYGLSIIPLYDTLGVENLTYCLEHSEITSCFVTKDTIPVILQLKGQGNLKNLICYDRLPAEMEAKIKDHKFNLYYFEEMTKTPTNLIDFNTIPVNQNTCLTFSYTSGTTGPPKGAMLSHGNFLAFVSAFHNHEVGTLI